jgi:hypothetical protein
MSRLTWALYRLPVRLIVAGVGRSRALPAPAGEGRARWAPDPSALGLAALERAARAGERRLEDPERRWRELVNKVRAFADFRSAADPGVRPASAGDDETRVFADLWRREGLGYLRGREAAGGGRVVGDPTRRERLPHHTGLGLGLATHHLERLPARPDEAAAHRAVDGFLEDARRLAHPGYEGAVVEALGLTVWLTRPELLGRVDKRLARRSARARQLFWHGLGRGLYFDSGEMAPRPGRRWRAAERALEMGFDEQSRRNAVAGVAWAATLVNFLDPDIVAARLASPELAEAGDAAANGIASAGLLWLTAVGDTRALGRLRGFRPAAGAGGEELWRRYVSGPLGLAVDRVYPLLEKPERIGELFRYRPVEGWASSLAEEPAAGAERELEVPLHG